MTKNISQIARELSTRLMPIYNTEQNALSHAWWLLEWLTNKPRTQLIAQKDSLSQKEAQKLADAEYQLIIEHKPLAYIIGAVEFLDLKLIIKPPILIPRPETEQWCSWFIQELTTCDNKQLTILDLCTGSGCIALALANTFKDAHVYAVDSNSEACELTQQNAKLNNISNITIIQSDLYQQLPLDVCFDFIVSNPPYISYTDWQKLDPMVKEWEDPKALVAEDNGLYLIKKIIEQAPSKLCQRDSTCKQPLPQLVIEIGNQQGQSVKKLFSDSGFKAVKIMQDFFGQDRIVTGELAR